MTRRYMVGIVLYKLAFTLAFVNVAVTLFLIVGLALLFVLPEPTERPRKNSSCSEDATTESAE